MDFLEIRKKAKERAAAREVAVPSPGQAAAPQPAAAGPTAGEVLAEVVAAGPPPPGSSDPATPPGTAADAPSLFTTWRPGSGARPVIPELPLVEPEPGDFAVYAPQDQAIPWPESTPVVRAPAVLASLPSVPEAPRPLRPPQALPADPLDDFFFRADEAAPALPALGLGAAAPAGAAEEERAVDEYLTFLLGAEEYGVAIGHVREVLKVPPITEVPRAPASILGVVTVRGDVIAVFDPRRRLGLPPTPDVELTGRVVIVDDGEGPCGLLVDRLASVVRLPRGNIEPCPQGIAATAGECLAGIGRDRGRLFTVLELPALLRKAPGRRAEGRGHAGA